MKRLVICCLMLSLFGAGLFFAVGSYCDYTNASSFARMHCHMQIGSHLVALPGVSIQRAISFCNILAKQKEGLAHHCWDGAFLTFFKKQAFGASYEKSSLMDFCRRFDDQQYATCINQGWILFSEETKTAKGISNYCLMSPTDASRRSCLDILFQRAAANRNFDLQRIASFCNEFPQSEQGLCRADAAIIVLVADASRLHEAVSLCKNSQPAVQTECFDSLFATAAQMFPPDNPTREALCGLLPTSYTKRCTNPQP